MDPAKSASASGLQTVVDVILAPSAAFERLRTAPTWGWAFLITLVLYALASYLITPAIVHGFQTGWPAMVAGDPRMAQLSPDKLQQALSFTLLILHFTWLLSIVGTPVAIFFTTIVMLVFNAVGRGSASFSMLWAAAANVSVPTLGLAGAVLAVIVLLRGADSFGSTMAVTEALPSLAWLAPSAGAKVVAFLSAFSVFQIWGAVLLYIAMRVTARVGAVPAILTALLLPICAGLFASFGAH
jgi:hypothetical protein